VKCEAYFTGAQFLNLLTLTPDTLSYVTPETRTLSMSYQL